MWTRLRSWLTGVGLIAASVAAAQGEPAAPVPTAWVAWAGELKTELVAWLAEDSDTAAKVDADLTAFPPAGPGETAIYLPLSVWVSADGTIARVETGLAGQAGLDADLAALLRGRRVATPPPAGLKLPIRLLA
jgi:hypothetical protein